MHSFRKALVNTMIFLSVVIIIAGCPTMFYFSYSINNWTATTDIVERASYAGQVDTLFTGASHGMKGFMPTEYEKVAGGCAYNLCGNLQTMKGRYALLKEEMDRNPVNTVFIEVSFNSLSRDSKEEGAEGDYDVVRRLITIPDKADFFFKNISIDDWAICYYLSVHNSFSIIIENILGNKEQELQKAIANKGFVGLEANDLSLSDEEYLSQSQSETILDTEIQVNIEYLNKMIDMAQEQGAEVILVTMPLSDRMINRTANLDKIYNQYVEIARKQGCDYYDFNLYKEMPNLLSDKENFYDDLHLAESGAEKFTCAFAELMKIRKRDSDVSDYFFSSYSVRRLNESYH